MFPEPALPDATLPLAQARVEAPLARGQTAGEYRLEYTPTGGEVIVIRRQGPDAMEMIGKHDPGINGERSAPAHQTNRVPEEINVPR